MKYTICFSGRLKNALGYSYHIQETITANSKQDAIIKLYDKYENVNLPTIIREEN